MADPVLCSIEATCINSITFIYYFYNFTWICLAQRVMKKYSIVNIIIRSIGNHSISEFSKSSNKKYYLYIRSSGKCEHVLALIVMIESWKNKYKEVPAEALSNSLPQQWDKPRGPKIQ